jgi:hypothetical protein
MAAFFLPSLSPRATGIFLLRANFRLIPQNGTMLYLNKQFRLILRFHREDLQLEKRRNRRS